MFSLVRCVKDSERIMARWIVGTGHPSFAKLKCLDVTSVTKIRVDYVARVSLVPYDMRLTDKVNGD